MLHQARPPEDYVLVLQQDAPEPMVRAEGRDITPQTLLDYSIEQFKHLPIDVYASDANHGGGVYYRSKFAERMLSSLDSFRGKDHVRMAERLEKLFDMDTDPLAIYCEGAHAAGIDYMIRLRMNDLHDLGGFHTDIDTPNRSPEDPIGEPYYVKSAWKRDHPECLLGDPADSTPQSASYVHWQRLALNYALAPVRRYIYGIAEELINNYDLDILELDFIRFTFYFRQAEAYAQRYVLTKLIRRIRTACEEAGQRRGRPVRLSARVPDTLELGLRAGIDTAYWLREGLLDMITIGGGYSPFGTRWEEIVSVARKAGIPALACLNHGFFSKDVHRIHAAALRAHEAGVSGYKLWNFWYCFDYYHPKDENPLSLDFVRDLTKPDTLAEKALVFQCDRILDPGSLLGGAHFHHTWPGQMPLTVGVADDGIGQIISFDIPQGVLTRAPTHKARIMLLLENFWASEDRIEFTWNETPLSEVDYELLPKEGIEKYLITCRISCERVKAGPNLLEIKLVENNKRVDPFISLRRAEFVYPDADGRLPPLNRSFA